MGRAKFKSSSSYTRHNKVELVRCGKPYFDCLKELIDNAERSFHLQVYIYEEDETGNEVAEALIAAAKRGVAVYLLADGYASKNLSHSFIERLNKAGVRFRFFQPLLKSERFYFGRRLHHKVAVADAGRCIIGGINISDRYNDMENAPAWLDWALLAEGQIAAELFKVCIGLWAKPGQRREKRAIYHDQVGHHIKENCRVRIRRNDWVKRKMQISGSYIGMLRQAESQVTIMSGYFLPGSIIRYNLSRAAKRGIDISIIVTGSSDVKLAKHAERFMYRWMLKRNIKVFEYSRTILHGKLATRDRKWVTIGSYNVNDISAYASVELNMDVDDAPFATSVQQKLDDIITSDCTQVTEEFYRTHYNYLQRFVQYISYITVRVIFNLFTFYFRQQ